MQIIEIDRSINEIFLLKSILNDEQIWFLEDDIFFTIIDGKIVKSIGLDNDFEILSYKGFQSLKNNKSLIRFKNPESDYMEILFSYKFVKEGIMKKLVNGQLLDMTAEEISAKQAEEEQALIDKQAKIKSFNKDFFLLSLSPILFFPFFFFYRKQN